MAQVLLPCFLPSWPTVKAKIEAIQQGCTDVPELIKLMMEIHEISNVGLEEERGIDGADDGSVFDELQVFLLEDLCAAERQHFLEKTVKRIANLAGRLKVLRPPNGLRFSLQQQSGTTELNHSFVAALLANAFLSTFPNRSINTHPTLQNFNFTFFFKGLRDCPLQKAKLRSLFYYFDWITDEANQEQSSLPLKITRKVMTGKQWLTIDDWKECIVPLSSIEIRHDLKIEASSSDNTQIIFVSPRIGGEVLGVEPKATLTRESVQFTMCPELLVTLLNTEALEDNESLYVENCIQMSRITPKQKTIYESLEMPRLLSFGCMDAERYTSFVVDQFEEDNFLRELNKCFLTFHPNMSEFVTVQDYMKDRRCKRAADAPVAVPIARRLSPIGERGTPQSQILVNGASTSTPRSSMDTDSELVIEERPSWLSVKPRQVQMNAGPGKFIVLGSSGECFPVNRPVSEGAATLERFSSCDSESSEEFHSAKESVDEEEDEDQSFADKYLSKLYSPEKRFDFARRLREALNEDHGSMRTDSTDDSYEAGAISVKGPDVFDVDRIRIKRRGSGGFVLQEDSSFDEEVLQELILRSAEKERLSRGDSSKYSFSTDLSSELSELQLSSEDLEMLPEDMRNKAVIHFATSILKRGFSESLVGCGEFPTNENDNNIFPASLCDVNNNSTKDKDNEREKAEQSRQQNCYNNSRSLSVEVVKQKHLLAAKLIGDILQKRSEPGEKKKTRIASGNWGCGRQAGDVQLKFILQWIAASLAGVKLIYHTAGHEKLSRLDTVCRILRDRKWSVGRLARSTLISNQYFLENPAQFIIEGTDNKDFFDNLLGIGRRK